MSGITTTYSSTSVINQKGISIRLSTDTVPPNQIAYTCPTGTTARVSGTLRVIDVKTSNAIGLAVKRVGDVIYYNVAPLDQIYGLSAITVPVILHAGDMITSVGNAGTPNGISDVDLSIQEVVGGNVLPSFINQQNQPRKKEKKNVRNK